MVWGVRTGQEYIKVNWPVNNVLSYKRLSLTLSILLALASASRAIQIHFLDISHMGRLPDQYKFVYTKLHKNWRKGKSPPASVSFAYTKYLHMCVVKCLDSYLDRTKVWRDGKNQLLLSFTQSNKKVCRSAICYLWLKETLIVRGYQNFRLWRSFY